jgi:hypothetical protein
MQLFGFKHTLNDFSHEEMSIQKSRLSGRLLQVNGIANLPRIFPFLAKRVNASLETQVESGKATRGLLMRFMVRMSLLTTRRRYLDSCCGYCKDSCFKNYGGAFLW